LGAISTVSWLYASFIGVSRLIAPLMSFTKFIALYGAIGRRHRRRAGIRPSSHCSPGNE
jgi:hypothetical protein